MSKKVVLFLVVMFMLSACFCAFGADRYEGETIAEISVSGNQQVSESIILSRIRTKPKDTFDRIAINEDLKRLYDSGYFSSISVQVQDTELGLRVIFVVKERPVLKEIIFIGNKKFKSSKLSRVVKSKTGEILDESKVKEDIEAIKDFYEEKGFTLADVRYDVSIDEATGRAIVTVHIEEGMRVRIADIVFTGNDNFKPKQILKVMRTRRDSLFVSGILKEEQFHSDLANVIQFYRNNGYLDAKFAEVKRVYSDEQTKVWLTLEISEGRQYFAGKISVDGNEQFSEDELRKKMKTRPGNVFSPAALSQDMSVVRDLYYAKGYLDASVRANTTLDEGTGLMDISYKIFEGDITYVGGVDVRGNTRTKDVVIRRELLAIPGQVCDSVKLRKSQERLQNLGYFKYVDVSLRPTQVRNVKDVVVEVEEQKTGEISFGGGYSSIDYLIGFVEISQKNFDIKNFPSFIGAGQKMRLRAEFGSKRQDYVLSFTEPWFLGRRLAAGFDLFKSTSKYLSKYFDEERWGGNLRLGVGMGEFNRADLIYTYQKVDIVHVREDASWEIKQEAGVRYVSSMELALTRDTRDSWIFPTRGHRITIRPEVAGLGGDTNYWKVTGSASVYIPLFFDHVIRIGGQAGIVDRYGNSDRVPIFDRFFLGGANTIRGFDYRAISPRDENNEPIGGNTMGMATAEYTFPLITRVRGAAFFDIGGVFPDTGQFDPGNLNGAVGVGIRLNLPIGPIQVDYGWPVITDEVNRGEKGRFSFTMGSTF